MKTDTARKLVEINRRFYDRHATDFDRTRGSAWAGWQRVADHLLEPPFGTHPIRVLDVGCGNGRLAPFLRQRLERLARTTEGPRQRSAELLRYVGVDASPALLESTRRRCAEIGVSCDTHRLELLEWVLGPDASFSAVSSDGSTESVVGESVAAGSEGFDLVALFGVLHHLPGSENRAELLRRCAAELAPGGLLAVTSWRFGEDPRFEARRLEWSRAGIDPGEVETGDWLLRWGPATESDEVASPLGAARYCHALCEEELARMTSQLELEVVDRFQSDGRGGRLNTYWIGRRARA